MNFLEKDLEDILFSTDSDVLSDRGIQIYPNRKRQLRIGNYGVMDILAYNREFIGPYPKILKMQVIELKKEIVNVDTFLQAVRYAKGIVNYLQFREKDISFDIEIVLIGRHIDLTTPLVYFTDLFVGYEGCKSISAINFFTYKYKIDGLHFEMENDYCASEQGFKL